MIIEEVDIVFNYGGNWVISPELSYNKRLVHKWEKYDSALLFYDDIIEEFTTNLGFRVVKQLLVTGPSGTYYLVKDGEGIRTLQYLFSNQFKVINFFAVDENELTVRAQNITHHQENYLVDVDEGTDQEHSISDILDVESELEEYNPEELEILSKERDRVVGNRLEKFKHLEKGMTFKDLKEARQIVNYYVVANKRAIEVKKSDRTRIRYVCQEGCPFVCLISRDGRSEGFKIKTLNLDHNCDEVFENNRADAATLAQYFKNKVQGNPKFKVSEMRGELENDLSLNVSKSKLRRVKKICLQKLEGSFIDEFNKLEAYSQELKKSNPGSDVVINISKDALLEGKRRFLRMYVCFNALKQGWKSGLRPLIGLDGTFLRGICSGQLLVAIGQDSMHHFYPIAWAIVDKENERTWAWFIELLKRSLELHVGAGVTFISDMQKGLLKAVKNVLPESHHRYCVRHIEANWCKRWKSGEMRKYMWWCAWSSYEEDFNDQLRKLGTLSVAAARELVNYPPQAWSRAFFDTQCKNMMVDNNFTESFNSWILDARQKPIIKMLEEIRIKVMGLLVANEDKGRVWDHEFSPNCMKLFQDYRAIAQVCKAEFNGDNGYEITEGGDRHTLCLEEKRCTCRVWDLSGIPCPHAIKALLHKKVDPKTALHWWHSREAYMLTYKHKLQPVRGQKFWKIEASHAMLPPEFTRQVGRPRVLRVREPDEARLRAGLWTAGRKGTTITCSNCGEPNHNARGCFKASTDGQTSQSSQPRKRSRSSQANNDVQSSQATNVEVEADTQQSQVSDYAPFGPESEVEADVPLRPTVVSETQTVIELRKIFRQPTGNRKIHFKGDETGACLPTNLAYEPTRATWKGNDALLPGELQQQAKKKRYKQMARGAKDVKRGIKQGKRGIKHDNGFY